MAAQGAQALQGVARDIGSFLSGELFFVACLFLFFDDVQNGGLASSGGFRIDPECWICLGRAEQLDRQSGFGYALLWSGRLLTL